MRADDNGRVKRVSSGNSLGKFELFVTIEWSALRYSAARLMSGSWCIGARENPLSAFFHAGAQGSFGDGYRSSLIGLRFKIYGARSRSFGDGKIHKFRLHARNSISINCRAKVCAMRGVEGKNAIKAPGAGEGRAAPGLHVNIIVNYNSTPVGIDRRRRAIHALKVFNIS